MQMTKVQFREAIKRGLGSALLQLERDFEAYREEALWACLHNTCNDMQSEGSRGVYLYEACIKFPDPEYFADTVIQQLFNSEPDTWLFDQWCGILYEFSRHGYQPAADALYRRFQRLLIEAVECREKQGYHELMETVEWMAVWLTELDGLQGFNWILSKIEAHEGPMVEKLKQSGCTIEDINQRLIEESPFLFHWFFDNVKNKIGEKQVVCSLESYKKQTGAYPAFYLYAEKKAKERAVQRRDTEPPALQQVLESIQKGGWAESRGILVRFARYGTPAEQRQLAEAGLQEQDPRRKACMLWPFTIIAFPIDSLQAQQAIIKDTKSSCPELQDTAFLLLQKWQDTAVRQYALELLEDESCIAEGVCILCANYCKEDQERLIEAVKKISVTDTSHWHNAFSCVLSVIETNRYGPKELLPYLYQQTLCSYCREQIVRVMHKKKMLTKELAQECAHDCNLEIRRFVKRIKIIG